jgi:L-rhamnose-H+ transport protein
MTENFWLGMVIVFAGGLLNGSFPLPMKYARWRWENTWLIFALVALIIIPWALAGGFVPSLGEVYYRTPTRVLLYPLIFGFLWGIAQTTFGIGLKALGMALAFSVVAGLGALLGSVLPPIILNPSDLFRPRGLLLMASLPILLAGLYLYAKAGRRRDREKPSTARSDDVGNMSFAAGLGICIFTGVVGTCWNLGFALSGGLIAKSAEMGASQATAGYAVWPLLLGMGAIPNLLYCGYLLTRNKGWGLFAGQGWARELFLGAAMGVLWLSGIVTYGYGTTLVGKYGTSVGFALFVSAVILASNTLGILTGEWKGTAPLTRRLLYAGVGVIILSVIVLSLGGLFSA